MFHSSGPDNALGRCCFLPHSASPLLPLLPLKPSYGWVAIYGALAIGPLHSCLATTSGKLPSMTLSKIWARLHFPQLHMAVSQIGVARAVREVTHHSVLNNGQCPYCFLNVAKIPEVAPAGGIMIPMCLFLPFSVFCLKLPQAQKWWDFSRSTLRLNP